MMKTMTATFNKNYHEVTKCEKDTVQTYVMTDPVPCEKSDITTVVSYDQRFGEICESQTHVILPHSTSCLKSLVHCVYCA